MTDSDSDISADSDKELQKAFSKKELKPGLNVLVPVQRKIFQNDVKGLKSKLNELRLNLSWVERLDLTNGCAPMAPELVLQTDTTSPNDDDLARDDFKRELNFYSQAQAAAMEAVPRLHKLGVKTKRPDDYFAQMAKSDDHMKKVREALLSKQTVLERRDKARKLRELKKYGKQVQREVTQQRLKEKKEMLENVKKMRKGQNVQQDDFTDTPVHPNARKSVKTMKRNSSAKKKFKDNRFGYGGQKKRSKYNTADSSADVSTYRHPKPKGKKGKQNKSMRPGKQRRAKQKNRKSR